SGSRSGSHAELEGQRGGSDSHPAAVAVAILEDWHTQVGINPRESLMRRILQLSALGLLGSVVSSCQPDRVVGTTAVPVAGVRSINAFRDTGAAFGLAFRFIDMVENSDAFRITFRNTPATSGAVVAAAQIQYKPAQVGSRHFRIFLSDSLQSVATVVLKD